VDMGQMTGSIFPDLSTHASEPDLPHATQCTPA
jgi:hypothetical protein